MEQISWDDAVEFCARLTNAAKKIYEFCLPTEAEWKYAARAGTDTPFAFGETIRSDIVNYEATHPFPDTNDGLKGPYRRKTVPVGEFKYPNQFGLYQMHRNIYEWCQDFYHNNYHGIPQDGSAWITGGDHRFRIRRGGSWYYGSYNCRSADRDRKNPETRSHNIGLRIMMVAKI